MRAAAASVILFTVFSAYAETNPPWASAVDSMLKKSSFRPSNYGLEIRDLDSGATLFARGADRALNPASAIKLLTSAAALAKLGPNFRFETIVFRAGQHLCLKGGGDPYLTNETLWNLVEDVRRKGVTEIHGNLIVDETLFPSTRPSLSEFHGDRDRAFTAPVGALSANFNSITIYAEPGQIGKPAHISVVPQLPEFQLKSRAITTKSGTKRDIDASISEKNGQFEISIAGSVGANNPEYTIYRAVPNPALYTAYLFLEHFRRSGGKIHGKVQVANCPAESKELFRFNSLPLSHVVFGLNKFSNNFIADMLLRLIGSNPTAESGLEEIRSWLNVKKIPSSELVLENGSGLSRKTRVSAHTLNSIVSAAVEDFRIAPEYLSSLGIAGVDGTLRRRFTEGSMQGSIRAKSGQLDGVASLAGVARSERFSYLFSFLFEVPSGEEWRAQQLQEDILSYIVLHPSKR